MLDRLRSYAREAAKETARAALARVPSPLKDTVEKVRERYETGVIDAQKALEDLAAFEEQAIKVATQLLAFPFVTIGAVRELYVRVRALEGGSDGRDNTIRELTERVRELERRLGASSR